LKCSHRKKLIAVRASHEGGHAIGPGSPTQILGYVVNTAGYLHHSKLELHGAESTNSALPPRGITSSKPVK
jgi:hypothetical protein